MKIFYRFSYVLILVYALSCKNDITKESNIPPETIEIDTSQAIQAKKSEIKTDTLKNPLKAAEESNNGCAADLSKDEKRLVDDLRTSWKADNTIYVDDTLDWSSCQWLYFIKLLKKDASKMEITRYKAAFELHKSKYPEVAVSWERFLQKNETD